jgi:hypothetical protein
MHDMALDRHVRSLARDFDDFTYDYYALRAAM